MNGDGFGTISSWAHPVYHPAFADPESSPGRTGDILPSTDGGGKGASAVVGGVTTPQRAASNPASAPTAGFMLIDTGGLRPAGGQSGLLKIVAKPFVQDVVIVFDLDHTVLVECRPLAKSSSEDAVRSRNTARCVSALGYPRLHPYRDSYVESKVTSHFRYDIQITIYG